MKSKRIKVLQLLHQGNNSKTVLGMISRKKCVVKKYYTRNSLEFLREKEILGSLNHPSILRLFYIGKTRTLATDFVGETLRSLISRKNIGTEELAKFSMQILNALEYIHSKGIVHFDIKPENIVICGDILKIIDFDSAKYEHEIIKINNFTNTYTSLEYLVGLKTAHSFKDIWSFGCIFYEMVCYECLFKNGNAFKLVAEILQTFGSPDKSAYSDLQIKHLDFVNVFGITQKTQFHEKFSKISQKYHQILAEVFKMNPHERISAKRLKKDITKCFIFQ
ncbi:CMGC protein kinase [Vittaforma corneae ATCC 50505]|uniref:CMGC protein kinase n=1 Tax=Vittaforma corneae (strain ATCC 50505) TaxID=993615 RepID=L2GND1_VITCO|nr:CMGC protein kinase [Vittaforma corneae ATCC 50505]ELA42346.1 CMGC protein kinase [Vittaforma corneae ATCC 50505]